VTRFHTGSWRGPLPETGLQTVQQFLDHPGEAGLGGVDSKLTHAAEDGASTPMLMTLSGHTSVRSLAKYTKVSAEALGRWQAGTDPAARRRRRKEGTAAMATGS
jgi:hypothetical protein